MGQSAIDAGFRYLPVDFRGWPMVVHADMLDEVAYALGEAIEARKALILTDNFKPLDMAQLCANDEEAPYDVPLRPGAKRFYRRKVIYNTPALHLSRLVD